MPDTSFSSLSLNQNLKRGLEILGYEQMTAIQAHSLPLVLKGEDIIAQAKTGSGKTAAFGLGLLENLEVVSFRVQAMVLCPTRELANQVAEEIRNLAKALANVKVLTLTGGTPTGPQIGSLEHGVHIVVGTPGRVLDHLSRGTLKLALLKTLVLDEADRMLDMGFQEDIESIIEQTPERRQTLLFSATFPSQIEKLSRRFMKAPRFIKVDEDHNEETIEQFFYKVTDDDSRDSALKRILMKEQSISSLVFCNTKVQTENVAESLRHFGFSAEALHGDFEQRERDQTLARFSNNSISVLVATDVAARGLDISALETIVNYELAYDPEVHVHRVGRTGRAGSSGRAHTLFTTRDEIKLELMFEAKNNFDISSIASELPHESVLDKAVKFAPMVTLRIEGGKKDKLRPGDILGALTGESGLDGADVGKIKIQAKWSFVAVHSSVAKRALKKLSDDKLKGRHFRVRVLK